MPKLEKTSNLTREENQGGQDPFAGSWIPERIQPATMSGSLCQFLTSQFRDH